MTIYLWWDSVNVPGQTFNGSLEVWEDQVSVPTTKNQLHMEVVTQSCFQHQIQIAL